MGHLIPTGAGQVHHLQVAGSRGLLAATQIHQPITIRFFYSIRSERLLMEQLDYNLLCRWFVGMDMDERIWDPTVFTKNRDRLVNQDIAVERGKDLPGSENERHANRETAREASNAAYRP
jgi:hypothetical protein